MTKADLTKYAPVALGVISGGRLPEGATTLPKDCRIVWRRVTVEAPYEIM